MATSCRLICTYLYLAFLPSFSLGMNQFRMHCLVFHVWVAGLSADGRQGGSADTEAQAPGTTSRGRNMHYRRDARTAKLALRNSKRAGKMDAEMDPVFPLCSSGWPVPLIRKAWGPALHFSSFVDITLTKPLQADRPLSRFDTMPLLWKLYPVGRRILPSPPLLFQLLWCVLT